MARRVRSARGAIVDFDMLKIKRQILTTPKDEAIANRERFIDKKRRRVGRTAIDHLLTQRQQAVVEASNQTDAAAATPVPAAPASAPSAPSPEGKHAIRQKRKV